MDGKVVFAGPFRGYGQILILQHAGGYHSFLAGFGRIDAEMGQDVAKGEPLGVLPAKNGTKPELYFEWRRNNEAVDPTAGIALSKSE
jgi:septal ring factor EnvC (AmiA/AmiB activator)